MKDPLFVNSDQLGPQNCLVLDLGTATTKSGWSTKSEPDFTIPSIVGHGRHKGAMLTLGLKDNYVGRQAQALQGILNVRQPFKQGSVQHWDDLELLWKHVWQQEIKRIRVSKSPGLGRPAACKKVSYFQSNSSVSPKFGAQQLQ